MRSFISLNIDEDVKEKIHKIQNEVKDYLGEEKKHFVRWEKKDKFHMTLFFLGDATPDMVNDLIKELEFIKLKPDSEIFFYANSISAFPRLKYSRVLFVDMYNKDKKALELYNKLYDALKLFRFKPDKKFHPHITLGRVKRDQKLDLTGLKDTIKFKIKFSINSFYLMESKLDFRGSEYKVTKRFVL